MTPSPGFEREIGPTKQQTLAERIGEGHVVCPGLTNETGDDIPVRHTLFTAFNYYSDRAEPVKRVSIDSAIFR